MGVSKTVNAELFEVSLPESLPFPILTSTDLYDSLCQKSKSYQHLLTQVVHLVITPQLWLHRARDTITIKNSNNRDNIKVLGEISFKTKIQLAFYYLIKNSQELHPPPQLDAGHDIICLLYTSPSPRD